VTVLAVVCPKSLVHKEHVVLGIHDGHNASACLLKDGSLIAALAEERITRSKNDCGYPKEAIETVLRMAGCHPTDLDTVALGTRFMHHKEFFYSWDWYRKDYHDQLEDAEKSSSRQKYLLETRLAERKALVSTHLGVATGKVAVVDHHEAHAASAYFGSPWASESGKTLVLTLDGSGDGVCATVNVCENGCIRRIAETPSSASIGKIYSRITFLLGMKPWEHEYKVMGLAPYADEAGLKKSYRAIRPLIEIDESSLVFRPGTHLWTNYCYGYLRSALETHRFDWICGAIQRVTEELVLQWVRNAVAATGISRIALAGGVFMNVKLNMLLAGLPEVEDLFTFPSCGDESISIGAAYAKGKTPECFRSVYLGPEFAQNQVDRVVASRSFFATPVENANQTIAELLAAGNIVARFSGRMEWGARALGNRSILMDPRNVGRVRELNGAIKHRDFWMPFAPTILRSAQSDYLVNRNGVDSPHMMMAFETTGLGKESLKAAMHPHDGTVRPQILDQRDNPDYHDLISRFAALTGVGALLNTSFNLHGEPMVCSPEDAVSTFERSGLELLALDNVILSKHELAHYTTSAEGIHDGTRYASSAAG
jgi:carbamoyltransferase